MDFEGIQYSNLAYGSDVMELRTVNFFPNSSLAMKMVLSNELFDSIEKQHFKEYKMLHYFSERARQIIIYWIIAITFLIVIEFQTNKKVLFIVGYHFSSPPMLFKICLYSFLINSYLKFDTMTPYSNNGVMVSTDSSLLQQCK